MHLMQYDTDKSRPQTISITVLVSHIMYMCNAYDIIAKAARLH